MGPAGCRDTYLARVPRRCHPQPHDPRDSAVRHLPCLCRRLIPASSGASLTLAASERPTPASFHPAEYRQHIEKDAAFERRFQKVALCLRGIKFTDTRIAAFVSKAPFPKPRIVSHGYRARSRSVAHGLSNSLRLMLPLDVTSIPVAIDCLPERQNTHVCHGQTGDGRGAKRGGNHQHPAGTLRALLLLPRRPHLGPVWQLPVFAPFFVAGIPGKHHKLVGPVQILEFPGHGIRCKQHIKQEHSKTSNSPTGAHTKHQRRCSHNADMGSRQRLEVDACDIRPRRALVIAAELSDRYITDRFLPDKVRLFWFSLHVKSAFVYAVWRAVQAVLPAAGCALSGGRGHSLRRWHDRN